MSEFPSKSAIQKAGKQLRDHLTRRKVIDDEALARAIEIVTVFREAHGPPMAAVQADLTSKIIAAQVDGAAVTSRHKRVPRIVRKLVRMDGTNLSRLEDIGGCRVVVEDLMDMDPVCDMIFESWESAFTRPMRDYVACPKDTGYRARHFVVVRDERRIEIQVRTVGQQNWAEAVEALDARRDDLELKDGKGPDVVLEYFRAAGEAIYVAETGAQVPPEMRARMADARRAVIAAGYYGK